MSRINERAGFDPQKIPDQDNPYAPLFRKAKNEEERQAAANRIRRVLRMKKTT